MHFERQFLPGRQKKILIRGLLVGAATLGFCLWPMASMPAVAQAAATAGPRTIMPAAGEGTHVNRAIEKLSRGETIYAIKAPRGGYEEGKKFAKTTADYISYDMENGAFDFASLRAFMQGLADGSGTDRRPPVIITLPALGDDPVSVKANAWMFRQALAAGVSGIVLCHAESPEAVRIFVESARYPFAPGADYHATHRGFDDNEPFAAAVWGVTGAEYLQRADVWPINSKGDILLGIKIENPKAAAHAEELVRIPGIGFIEWGTGDQAFYLVANPWSVSREVAVKDPKMVASRTRILAAAKTVNMPVLTPCTEANVIDQLKAGARICAVADLSVAEKGRAFTRSTSPRASASVRSGGQ